MWISIMFLYSLVCSVGLLLMYAAIRLSRVSMTPNGRFAILAGVITVIAASCMPFIIGWLTREPVVIYAVVQEFTPSIDPVMIPEPVAAEPTTPSFNLWTTLCSIYIIGFSLASCWLIVTITRILMLILKSERHNEVFLTKENSIVPFSWGGKIIMTRNDYDSYGEMLIAHESAHRDAHHWLDLLLMNLLGCLTWYCPAARMIKRELQSTHEFAADRAVLQAGFDSTTYQMLLISKATGRRFANSVADCINNHSLKSRIIMMQKKSPMRRRLQSSLALIPAGLTILALASSPVLAEKAESLMPAEVEIVTPDNGKTALPNEVLITGMDAPEHPSNPKQTNATTSTEEQPAAETPAKEEKEKEKTFTTPEKSPQFPGGDKELYAWIAKNLRYPAECHDRNIQGRVIVSFRVMKDGSIDEVKVVRSVDPQLDGEAVRICRTLPKFEPGTMNGEPVTVWYTLPMNFKLEQEEPALTNQQQ